jgi:hypothetical protein
MRKNTLDPGSIAATGLLCLAAACGFAFVYGYIQNIVDIVRLGTDAAVNVEMVLRVLGIVFAPLGAIMGLFV